MGAYLLVHGATHGAWCWYKVIARLREAGHKVVALDLPGHGVDRTPPEEVTFQMYVQRVCQALDTQEQPITLVGHSMAGAIISQVAERVPHRLHALVYVASPLLQSSKALMHVAMQDTSFHLEHAFFLSADRRVCHPIQNNVVTLFYHDCDTADRILAQALLTPQPLAPLWTPVQLSERYASVRRVSVETTLDRVVGIDLQRHQRVQTLCNQVYTLASGHCPFFSMPEELVQCLVAV